jgi:FdrA protein
MASGFIVRKNQYYDSVFLMGVSNRLSKMEGIQQTAVLMASDKNKNLLADIDIHGDEIDSAQPNDLIVAIIADSPQIIEAVFANLDQTLQYQEESSPISHIHTVEEGLAKKPSANLAVFSIPGEYTFREAMKALQANLNVFIFSSNVPLEEELKLKQFASQHDLLVMGPDCGTSILGGVGIGFANVVRHGTIGAIGPSGTGLQEFTSQVHNADYGISHAIGTGSHDLSDEIGGITTALALEALEVDDQTKVIAIVAKPPGKKTLQQLVTRLKYFTKPIVVCFLGVTSEQVNTDSEIIWTHTIDDAVQSVIQIVSHREISQGIQLTEEEREHARKIRGKWSNEQCYLRGLFAGGTFCYQSQQILLDHGIEFYSNAPIKPEYILPHPDKSFQHTLIDMGDDAYTLGRPHPMIDGTIRKQRILTESQDPSVAILLLDFILGYNASSDPVGDLLDAIVEAKQRKQAHSGDLTIVASICGTLEDPQELDLQTKLLQEAGVIVFNSNARAALFCCELLEQIEEV